MSPEPSVYLGNISLTPHTATCRGKPVLARAEAGAPDTEFLFDIDDRESAFPRTAVESGARVFGVFNEDACVETSSYMASLREFFAVLRMSGLTSVHFASKTHSKNNLTTEK